MLLQNSTYLYNMIHHLAKSHSLVNAWMNELRDVNTQQDRARFRRNLERIGEVVAYEISKTMPYAPVDVNTPLGVYSGHHLAHQPVLGTIFRAGFPLYQGLLNFFDQADSAFIAAYRKHDKSGGSFHIHQGYVTCPNITDRTLIVADPMLATGASLITAFEELLDNGTPSAVHVVCAIGSTEGIETLHKRFPDFTLWIGDIDDELTAKGYIVPGLGDAGDLCFGEKLQH